ncbi:hypothetical protein B0H67DRAFT_604293 [Lasiosphaeris hirsuta]|uniref:Uncharacterized protein n=1 Tax=Lasiosphaeris hirsuta TaxID=260670 RepID=A0AA39ZXF5_9PEZI|nr:hypothetical protein B0H67DRAFT_604293 [Lasiosphaeris hirsuta]
MAMIIKGRLTLGRLSVRRGRELRHRKIVRRYAVDYPHVYEPNIQDLDHLTADVTLEQADDCCNKSNHYSKCITWDPHHIHLYDEWFRPSRRPGGMVDILIPVHAAISNRVKEARLTMEELDPACLNDDSIVDPKVPKRYRRGIFFFILQPLFRALAIIIRHESFDTDTSDIGQHTVILIRTGTEEGLSSRGELVVETTLETALDFMMDLEKREVAAFGPRPDPIASTEGFEDGYFRGPAEFYEAMCLGWPVDRPLVGPSSRWINVEKCPEWTG